MITDSVRPAGPNDIEALVELCGEHACFERARHGLEGKEDRLTEALFGESPRLKAWVAMVCGQAVGYATATEEFSTWAAASFLHLDCLFVRPNHRNGGVGAALLNAVVQYARDRNLREVQWQTPAWNVDACRFYRRHGAIAHHKVRFSLSTERPA
jgi:GNAT superfamily N-acetyltransferase